MTYEHADAKFFCPLENLLVIYGTSRLYDSRDSSTGSCFHAIREGEKGIGCHDGTLSFVTGLMDGEINSEYPAAETHSYTNGPAIPYKGYSIAFG